MLPISERPDDLSASLVGSFYNTKLWTLAFYAYVAVSRLLKIVCVESANSESLPGTNSYAWGKIGLDSAVARFAAATPYDDLRIDCETPYSEVGPHQLDN